jgi:corrinoid protein of di/trimethylamine methyltransferase
MECKEELVHRLSAAILDCDADRAAVEAQQVLDAGLDPVEILNTTMAQTAAKVGDRFESGEYHLPNLVLAGNAIEAASEVLQKGVPEAQLGEKKTVVIGTVEGDTHSLGKNIVATMLRAHGFEVYDLGVNVKGSAFIQRAQEVNADLIGLSCLMTTTLPYQREVIEDLLAQGLRDRFKVIVGGGPVTESWAQEIGADGFGQDVLDAVVVAKRLTGIEV